MGVWLLICSGLVFIMVVLGGVTRLTESGLSITDWRPITGSVPPLNQDDWEAEFNKYKQSPEFKKLNAHMNLEEFKKIYYMEWAHRFMGRFLGVAFGLPALFFYSRGWVSPSLAKKLGVLFGLGGLQGFIGWWMVKSGLQEDLEHPRVSPYRLATHLGSAFIIYIGLFWTGLSLVSPVARIASATASASAVAIPGMVRHGAHLVAGMTFLTAMSGAFVAGLDAGLLYPEIPYMGEGVVPAEYWDMKPEYLNMFENGAAVQFNHRVLATSTWVVATMYWLYARRAPGLTPGARVALNSLFGMANLQVLLGVLTLLNHVPVHLAATHQAGSLTLLTLTLALMHQLKKIPKLR
eukprot:TRINITY_DN1338_c3_g1_i4.p1 TRINITY_DN1338_c3_g1~~TRINITY_DN1338_c3_g1_i4.p1  ORF type:complete len:350 (+),score=48.62 TRINITY_DN1338_c3_g1_i4:61-1110(+)